ncbi:MAG: hypothetical protein ACREL7_09530 [Longimicrobiales bacterium]
MKKKGPGLSIVTANLKGDRPTVREAIAHMESELRAARRRGARLVRLIHGYGSSGTGGQIRMRSRARLEQMLADGSIRAFHCGEDLDEFSVSSQELLTRHPGLRSTLKTDFLNKGLTFVEL